MSTATPTTKAVPSHYQSVMDDADAMGWDVLCSDTSVKLTPPNAKRGEQIVLPLTSRWAPPQLQKVLADRGFIKALAAWERGQGKPEPKAEAPAPAPKGGKVKVCPECQEKGVSDPYASESPQGMAAHRRHVHDVAGTSPDALRKRAQQAAKKAPAKKAPAKKVTSVKKTAPAKKAAAPVPAPRAAEATKAQGVPVNVSSLPVAVAAPLGEMLNALQAELGNAADVEREIKPLREFFDKVDELVNDGNKTPIKILAEIQDLVTATKQK